MRKAASWFEVLNQHFDVVEWVEEILQHLKENAHLKENVNLMAHNAGLFLESSVGHFDIY